jgi:hypothetical protein
LVTGTFDGLWLHGTPQFEGTFLRNLLVPILVFESLPRGKKGKTKTKKKKTQRSQAEGKKSL